MPNLSDAISGEVATHTINLLRFSAGVQRKATAMLSRLEGELVQQLSSSNLSANRIEKTKALIQQARDTIKTTYADISDTTTRDLKGMARLQGRAAANSINRAIGVNVISSQVSESQLAKIVDETAVLGHKSADWWKAQSDDLRNKFTAIVQRGIYAGQSVDDMVRAVRGTATKQFGDGIMSTSKRNAETLVRSAVISVSNQARLDSFTAMPDVVKAVEWIATLDSRTTVICRALDRKQWSLPDMKPIGHNKVFPGATAHWNCRSTQSAVTKSWEELSGKKLKELDNATFEERVKQKLAARGMEPEKIEQYKRDVRASMDGQVSGGWDFEKWLDSKGETFANKMLGPGRYKLWKSGKLSVSDMTDQNNRPLTLEQLTASIDTGDLPPETTGAAFIAPAAIGAKFNAQVQRHIEEKAKTEIESVLRENPDSIKARELDALDGSGLTAAEKLSAATVNAEIKAAAQNKALVLKAVKLKAVKLGSLDAALDDAELFQAIKTLLHVGTKSKTLREWLSTQMNKDEMTALKEAVSDAITAKKAKK